MIISWVFLLWQRWIFAAPAWVWERSDVQDRLSLPTRRSFELTLWEQVVRGVALGYQVESQTGIVPAMNQLNLEHSLGLEDIVDLVVHNPFVPPGHEELFARGFDAALVERAR